MEEKKDLDKWRDMSYSLIGGFNIKLAVPLKPIYRFIVIPIKVLARIFVE